MRQQTPHIPANYLIINFCFVLFAGVFVSFFPVISFFACVNVRLNATQNGGLFPIATKPEGTPCSQAHREWREAAGPCWGRPAPDRVAAAAEVVEEVVGEAPANSSPSLMSRHGRASWPLSYLRGYPHAHT